MASEDQRNLATNIKIIHKELRDLCKECGYEKAWEIHMKDEKTRKSYAESMRELAGLWSGKNAKSEDRILWIVNFVQVYFNLELEKWYQKDFRTIGHMKNDGKLPKEEFNEIPGMMKISEKIECLDVGSSGNFFKNFENFNILPIDISPSDPSVYFCDFLSVKLDENIEIEDVDGVQKVSSLPMNFYDVVIFCLLLEYLPSSEMRINCCKKAYKVLKSQGILLIVTPDSNHELKNSKLIKHWQWSLAHFGFTRVKLTKLKNLTCMAFRKSLIPEISLNWAKEHQESFMTTPRIEIPQDDK